MTQILTKYESELNSPGYIRAIFWAQSIAYDFQKLWLGASEVDLKLFPTCGSSVAALLFAQGFSSALAF